MRKNLSCWCSSRSNKSPEILRKMKEAVEHRNLHSHSHVHVPSEPYEEPLNDPFWIIEQMMRYDHVQPEISELGAKILTELTDHYEPIVEKVPWDVYKMALSYTGLHWESIHIFLFHYNFYFYKEGGPALLKACIHNINQIVHKDEKRPIDPKLWKELSYLGRGDAPICSIWGSDPGLKCLTWAFIHYANHPGEPILYLLEICKRLSECTSDDFEQGLSRSLELQNAIRSFLPTLLTHATAETLAYKTDVKWLYHSHKNFERPKHTYMYYVLSSYGDFLMKMSELKVFCAAFKKDDFIGPLEKALDILEDDQKYRDPFYRVLVTWLLCSILVVLSKMNHHHFVHKALSALRKHMENINYKQFHPVIGTAVFPLREIEDKFHENLREFIRQCKVNAPKKVKPKVGTSTKSQHSTASSKMSTIPTTNTNTTTNIHIHSINGVLPEEVAVVLAEFILNQKEEQSFTYEENMEHWRKPTVFADGNEEENENDEINFDVLEEAAKNSKNLNLRLCSCGKRETWRRLNVILTSLQLHPYLDSIADTPDISKSDFLYRKPLADLAFWLMEVIMQNSKDVEIFDPAGQILDQMLKLKIYEKEGNSVPWNIRTAVLSYSGRLWKLLYLYIYHFDSCHYPQGVPELLRATLKTFNQEIKSMKAMERRSATENPDTIWYILTDQREMIVKKQVRCSIWYNEEGLKGLTWALNHYQHHPGQPIYAILELCRRLCECNLAHRFIEQCWDVKDFANAVHSFLPTILRNCLSNKAKNDVPWQFYNHDTFNKLPLRSTKRGSTSVYELAENKRLKNIVFKSAGIYAVWLIQMAGYTGFYKCFHKMNFPGSIKSAMDMIAEDPAWRHPEEDEGQGGNFSEDLTLLLLIMTFCLLAKNNNKFFTHNVLKFFGRRLINFDYESCVNHNAGPLFSWSVCSSVIPELLQEFVHQLRKPESNVPQLTYEKEAAIEIAEFFADFEQKRRKLYLEHIRENRSRTSVNGYGDPVGECEEEDAKSTDALGDEEEEQNRRRRNLPCCHLTRNGIYMTMEFALEVITETRGDQRLGGHFPDTPKIPKDSFLFKKSYMSFAIWVMEKMMHYSNTDPAICSLGNEILEILAPTGELIGFKFDLVGLARKPKEMEHVITLASHFSGNYWESLYFILIKVLGSNHIPERLFSGLSQNLNFATMATTKSTDKNPNRNLEISNTEAVHGIWCLLKEEVCDIGDGRDHGVQKWDSDAGVLCLACGFAYYGHNLKSYLRCRIDEIIRCLGNPVNFIDHPNQENGEQKEASSHPHTSSKFDPAHFSKRLWSSPKFSTEFKIFLKSIVKGIRSDENAPNSKNLCYYLAIRQTVLMVQLAEWHEGFQAAFLKHNYLDCIREVLDVLHEYPEWTLDKLPDREAKEEGRAKEMSTNVQVWIFIAVFSIMSQINDREFTRRSIKELGYYIESCTYTDFSWKNWSLHTFPNFHGTDLDLPKILLQFVKHIHEAKRNSLSDHQKSSSLSSSKPSGAINKTHGSSGTVAGTSTANALQNRPRSIRSPSLTSSKRSVRKKSSTGSSLGKLGKEEEMAVKMAQFVSIYLQKHIKEQR